MDGFLEVVYLAVFEACAADVFDCVTEVVVKVLVPYKIPYFDGSSGVVGGRFDCLIAQTFRGAMLCVGVHFVDSGWLS